jgi:hypothetical protein
MAKHGSQLADSEVLKLPVTQHTAAIERLAEDSHWPVPVVAEMYWHELTQLEEDATVQTYLGLLTARKVREALRHLPRRLSPDGLQ